MVHLVQRYAGGLPGLGLELVTAMAAVSAPIRNIHSERHLLVAVPLYAMQLVYSNHSLRTAQQSQRAFLRKPRLMSLRVGLAQTLKEQIYVMFVHSQHGRIAEKLGTVYL